MHAFRHTFKHHRRECGIRKDIDDAITGHESADAGDSYGGEHSLKPLVDAMRALRFQWLDFGGEESVSANAGAR